MQFSPASYHFISLRSKHFPQHPVLKHPQFIFLDAHVSVLYILRKLH
jgi:hypothetical protein